MCVSFLKTELLHLVIKAEGRKMHVRKNSNCGGCMRITGQNITQEYFETQRIDGKG